MDPILPQNKNNTNHLIQLFHDNNFFNNTSNDLQTMLEIAANIDCESSIQLCGNIT